MLTIVTGPPCSGKTTYIREHARPGDIRIDFDEIAQALGSSAAHGHGDTFVRVAVAARKAAIAAAISLHYRGARVWIIDTELCDAASERYARAGARLVRLTVAPGELRRRAAARRHESRNGA